MVYAEAKRIMIAYENKQGSIQSLIAQSKSQHKNSLTCLIMKTMSYKKLLNKIIKKSKMLENEKFLGDKLAQLLVYDVLFGMGVRGKFKSAVKRNYQSLTEACDHYMKKYQVDKRENLLKIFDEKQFYSNNSSIKPKYIYINQLKQKKKEIIGKLSEDSFQMVEYDRKCENFTKSNEEYKNLINSLKENEFIKDNHVKNLIIFKHDSIINKNYNLFADGHLLQIDKSSCLVPLALNPEKDSHVIDGASAPGNKTILISNILKNTGLIHAFDIDETRVKLMQNNLKQHHVTNVRLKCMDFLQTEIYKYDRVSHIMLDVPCSGSGMTNRMKFGDTDLENVKDDKRLWKLEALQRRMLLHAMSFQNVTRIVYSTCSIHQEENENVIRYALKNCDERFKLINLFADKWNYGRGICTDEKDANDLHLDYCIRTSFDSFHIKNLFKTKQKTIIKMYSQIIIFLAIFSIGTHSYLIESPIGEEDVCNFEDRRLAESVRLIRSKYNCRVYYVCAFYKQYSLICAEGLYFDLDSNSCNYQEIVKCHLPSDDYTFQETSNASYLIEENQESLNKSNLTQDDSFDSYLNQTNLLMNSTEEVTFSTYSSEIMSNLTEADFINESSNETFSSIDSQNISSTQMEATSTSSLPIQTFADVNNWWYGPSDCIEGFEHKLAHKENCALYFECTKEGDKIQKACPYPLQYDEMLNECRFYDLIECGTRKQAKDLCDYQINASLPSSIPCDKYPSCKDLSDGLYPSNDCKHYYQCKDERTLRIYSCPKDQKTGAQLKFNYLTKRCDFIENVSFNCGGYAIPIDIYTNKMVCPNKQAESNEQPSLETRDVYFSHPSECHLYVTCDIQGNMSILECFNGTHFSPYYQSCVHPSVVNCKKYPMVRDQTIYLLKSLLMEAKIKTGLINQTSEMSSESAPIVTTPIVELNTTIDMESSNNTNSTIF